MPDPTNSPNLGYPLPHPDNIAAEDATRLRQAILAVDGDLQVLIDGLAAVETVQSATAVGLAAVQARQARIETAILLGFDFT